LSFHKFKGTAKWAKLSTPDEYNDELSWKINLYMSPEEFKRFKATGIQLKVKEDEEGKFVTFRRPTEIERKGEIVALEKPTLYQGPAGAETLFEGEIGNGSQVTVKVEIYDTKKGKGHRLIAVRVDELVEYQANHEGF